MKKQRIIASIEARMGSTRLPGKVFADIHGKPALERLCTRLKLCRNIDDLIIATSTSPQDDVIADWAEAKGYNLHRGSEDDVLKRVVEAHQKMQSDIVVEICGDMILLDPELIDQGITTFFDKKCDVVTTTIRPSYPVGVDVLVFNLKELEWVEENISDQQVREHVSLYFFQHPERYTIYHLQAPEEHYAPHYRFVLDYPEDLEFIRQVYSRLEPEYGDQFGLSEIMNLVRGNPFLLEINSNRQETIIDVTQI